MIRKAAIILFGLAALSSCRVLREAPPKPCPDPPPPCRPGKASGIAIDTATADADKKPFYYKIALAQGINSRNNEYAVSFDGERRAILTYAEQGPQSLALFDRLSPREFTSASSISSGESGHIGFAVPTGEGSVYYAYSENTIFGKPKDESFSALVPLEKMIGISRLAKAKYDGENTIGAREPIEIEGADVLTWISQPAAARGVIIFASDLDGGLGGSDLWAVSSQGGKPINLGLVNTGCDELTPFISPDRSRLYFASAGGETYGGYDIFYSTINPIFWSDASAGRLREGERYFEPATNCGAPLNTPFDEISPACPSGDCDSLLYYASNQEGSDMPLVSKVGEFDIFYKLKLHYESAPVIARMDPIKKTLEPKTSKRPAVRDTFALAESFALKGVIYNERTRLPLPGVKIVAKPIFADDTMRVVYSDNEGKYSVDLRKGIEYIVTAEGRDVFYRNRKVFVPRGDTLKTTGADFALPEVITLRINFPTDVYDEPYRFMLDSSGLETGREWSAELDDLARNILESAQNIKEVLIVGHTDDVASDEYNLQLGRRRADFVLSQLLARGVPARLIVAKSAGENEPLPAIAGEDLDLKRKRMRRVTVEKILK